MKKLLLTLAMSVGIAGLSLGNSYRLNEQSVENSFAAASEQTITEQFNVSDFTTLNLTGISGDEPTKGGYLLRSFFCGFIGLHRSYMGTGGKTIWYYYCIPVFGGVVNCIDFWGVVFKGDEFWNKYKNNSKVVVWND